MARNRSETRTPNIVVPQSAHFSFWKAADVLGVELRTAPLQRYEANLEAIQELTDADTVMVLGVAGTTEYGRVDNIPALVDIATEVGALTHVDAAWGGFCLPFTDHKWDFSDADIDTMTIDPHKLGRAAVPAGGLLARGPELLDELAIDTPYLESHSQVTLTGTRSGAGVASTAAVMEELWRDGYRDQYETARSNARWLADTLAAHDIGYVEPELPIVAIALDPGVIDELRGLNWRLSRTEAGEARVVMMPHVTRSMLEEFMTDLKRIV
jgi:tyrosine decarboxylase/aspartate 1-decarboxylase